MSAIVRLFQSDSRGEHARGAESDPLNDNSKLSLSPTSKVPYSRGNTWTAPNGDREDYRRNTKNLTQMQKHIAFFDGDCDGILWPTDTFYGFYSLGFSFALSLLAAILVHGLFSYPTLPTKGDRLTDWIPDPFFRIWVANIQRCKHGSDSESFDHKGRLQQEKFDAMLEQYSSKRERDALSLSDLAVMMWYQANLMDLAGISGFFFEWTSIYTLLRPEDGYMHKDDILGVLDGSIFPVIAHQRKQAGKASPAKSG
ncbi:hypothetical protein ACQY0O_005749 [Thecaphora frezii]